MGSIELRYKKLHPDAKEPTQGSEYAAGYDLYAVGDYEIAPHGTVKIPTGIALKIPEGTFGAIFARSGLAVNYGLRPANCVGVVDPDYRGEIIVALHNDTPDVLMTISSGTRIAQLVIIPFLPAEFVRVDKLDETARGEGGFGSTGLG